MAMISFLVGIAGINAWRARWVILLFLAHLFFLKGEIQAQDQAGTASKTEIVWGTDWSLIDSHPTGMTLTDWQRALNSALVNRPPERVLGIPARHILASLTGRWKKALDTGQPVPSGSAGPFDPLALEQARVLFRSRMIRMGCLEAEVNMSTRFDQERVTLLIELTPGVRAKCGAVVILGDGSGITPKELSRIDSHWQSWAGKWLDLDALDRARSESATRLQAEGWFGLMAEHFTLDIDTTNIRSTGTADLVVHIAPRNLGGTMSPHRRGRISSVNVDWQPQNMEAMENRTVNGVAWHVPQGRDIRTLQHLLQVAPGDLFDPSKLSASRQGFRSLAIVDQVALEIEPTVDSTSYLERPLAVTFGLQPNEKRLMRVNGALTSRQRIGGEVTLALGNLDFRERAEQLTLDLQAGRETVSNSLNDSSDPSNAEGDFLNSRILSAALQYQSRRLIPFGVDRFPRSNRPESRLSMTFHDEKRPRFSRTYVQLGLVEQFTENERTGSKLEVRPFEVAMTSSQLTSDFETSLIESGSAILVSSFSSRALFASGISWWISPKRKKGRPGFRCHLEVESAGALFHWIDPRQPRETNIQLPSAFGLGQKVDVARYTRWVLDVRGDWQWRPRSGIHMRGYLGVAASSIDSSAAPLEKQFYVGGANSMRGWRALGLGLGGEEEDELNVRGDMRMEFNIEARQFLNDWIQIAAFMDIGNVWMTRYEAERPKAHFQWSRFHQELGVSVGCGIRLDFGYFLLRCDAGRPVRWPNEPNPTSESWRIHPAVSLPF